MSPALLLALGVVCAVLGGELFVRGATGLARLARVPAHLIGVTVAAFATSSPELAVAVNAGAAGVPDIALGDAVGTNVANVGLILGAALLLSGMAAPRDSVRRDFPVALLTPLLTLAVVLDGEVSRLDAGLFLALFAAWLAAVVREARRQRGAVEEGGPLRRGPVVGLSLLGLALLVLAGRLIVVGAQGLAAAWELDKFVVGATVVALATSTPELATTLIAKWRGHADLGLGTILGSNIFNTLFIVSVAALITPIALDWRTVAVGLLFGLLTVAVTWPTRAGWIGRGRGVVLLALYVAYVVAILGGPG
ncbi:sodium:calcium antiporter [Deinococcus planocerae]|uniref:sodium:calcium antiporter n=1 Tax=Deinococcus planocerae TaxID=1737569 RepID=UPI000C7F2C5F|nr:sodium:calcium antiporter [Deinococcus planocerae]